MKLITSDLIDVIDAAELARHGSWPVAGGWADQTRVCIDAVRTFWREEDYWKAKL